MLVVNLGGCVEFEDAMDMCANNYVERIRIEIFHKDKKAYDVLIEHALFRSIKDAYKHGFEMSRKLSIENENKGE